MKKRPSLAHFFDTKFQIISNGLLNEGFTWTCDFSAGFRVRHAPDPTIRVSPASWSISGGIISAKFRTMPWQMDRVTCRNDNKVRYNI